MYLYYFLSAFGPKMQPFLWWKRWVGCNNNDKDTKALKSAMSVFKQQLYIVAIRHGRTTWWQLFCPGTWPDCRWSSLSASSSTPSFPFSLTVDILRLFPWCVYFFFIQYISLFVFLNMLICLYFLCAGDVCKCSCILCSLCKLLLLCLCQEASRRQKRISNEEECIDLGLTSLLSSRMEKMQWKTSKQLKLYSQTNKNTEQVHLVIVCMIL